MNTQGLKIWPKEMNFNMGFKRTHGRTRKITDLFMRPNVIVGFALVAMILSFLFGVISEAQSSSSKVVRVISVDGNKAISTPTILSKIKTKPGSVFSQEVTTDDIKRLYALGYFTDVAIDAEDYEDGVKVTVIVEEKPVIADIVFTGNSRIRTQQLKKVMQTKA